jgi:osmotically-inducible protein OsmY
MRRYDSGWGRFTRGGYDSPDFRASAPYDAGISGFGAAVYGPERYGLGPYHERLRRKRRDDAELKEDVEDALFYDTWVDAEAIAVEVQDGVVTLSGALPSYEEIRYATDDAWDVDGVIGVRSELKLRE